MNDKKSLEERVDSELKKKFSSFLMNQAAFEKIKAYSRILKELAGTPLECEGYLLAPLEEEFFEVHDAVYYMDQTVSSVSASGAEQGEELTQKVIEEQSKRIIGVWHSHADLGYNHTSGTDEEMKDFLYLKESHIDLPLAKLDPKAKNKGSIQYPSDPDEINIGMNLGDIVLEVPSSKEGINIFERIDILPRFTLLIDNKGLMLPQLHYQIFHPKEGSYGEVKTIDLDEKEILPFTKEADYSELELAETILNSTFVNGRRLSEYPEAQNNFQKKKDEYTKAGFTTKEIVEIDTGKLQQLTEQDFQKITPEQLTQAEQEKKAVEELYDSEREERRRAEKVAGELEGQLDAKEKALNLSEGEKAKLGAANSRIQAELQEETQAKLALEQKLTTSISKTQSEDEKAELEKGYKSQIAAKEEEKITAVQDATIKARQGYIPQSQAKEEERAAAKFAAKGLYTQEQLEKEVELAKKGLLTPEKAAANLQEAVAAAKTQSAEQLEERIRQKDRETANNYTLNKEVEVRITSAVSAEDSKHQEKITALQTQYSKEIQTEITAKTQAKTQASNLEEQLNNTIRDYTQSAERAKEEHASTLQQQKDIEKGLKEEIDSLKSEIKNLETILSINNTSDIDELKRKLQEKADKLDVIKRIPKEINQHYVSNLVKFQKLGSGKRKDIKSIFKSYIPASLKDKINDSFIEEYALTRIYQFLNLSKAKSERAKSSMLKLEIAKIKETNIPELDESSYKAFKASLKIQDSKDLSDFIKENYISKEKAKAEIEVYKQGVGDKLRRHIKEINENAAEYKSRLEKEVEERVKALGEPKSGIYTQEDLDRAVESAEKEGKQAKDIAVAKAMSVIKNHYIRNTEAAKNISKLEEERAKLEKDKNKELEENNQREDAVLSAVSNQYKQLEESSREAIELLKREKSEIGEELSSLQADYVCTEGRLKTHITDLIKDHADYINESTEKIRDLESQLEEALISSIPLSEIAKKIEEAKRAGETAASLEYETILAVERAEYDIELETQRQLTFAAETRANEAETRTNELSQRVMNLEEQSNLLTEETLENYTSNDLIEERMRSAADRIMAPYLEQINSLKVDKLYLKAINFQKDERLDQALVLYQQITELEPNHSDALYNIGAIQLDSENPIGALHVWERAASTGDQHIIDRIKKITEDFNTYCSKTLTEHEQSQLERLNTILQNGRQE